MSDALRMIFELDDEDEATDLLETQKRYSPNQRPLRRRHECGVGFLLTHSYVHIRFTRCCRYPPLLCHIEHGHDFNHFGRYSGAFYYRIII